MIDMQYDKTLFLKQENIEKGKHNYFFATTNELKIAVTLECECISMKYKQIFKYNF